ncbi:MAG: zinc ABC transporter ATP-binding protein ZnuC [Pseudomonadota bacterium]
MPHDAPIAASEAPLVAVERLTQRFGADTILDAVDLSVAAGEIVTLIGPNGAGKTTLVRVVLGLLAPSAGRVRRRPDLKIGYMPQRFELPDTLPITVERFLSLAGRVDRAMIADALREVGAQRLLGSAMQSLSGGELQRVLLARALVREPELLVLDEPVRGVDVSGQAELYDLIAQIRRSRGCGVLMVSHDLHLVMAATDRVICLNHHVCCAGRPETVSEHPEYLALFGAGAAERIAFYTHHHDHEHGLAGEIVAQGEHGHRHGPHDHDGPDHRHDPDAGPHQDEAPRRRAGGGDRR